jgi:hypothetical protein
MRALLNAVTLCVVGWLIIAVATLSLRWPFSSVGVGELRCEGSGAVVIKILGKDYAVNGMASSRYPPVQQIWNNQTYPDTDIDRLVARGLTLCDW